MILKLSKSEIEELTKDNFQGISESDRDEMAIPSYSHSNPMIRWLMWKRLETAFLMAEIGKDKTVLDFGCGVGVFLPTLANHFTNVYAVDLFPFFAQKLCEKKGFNVIFKDSVNDFEDGSIDIIFSTDVLEHVDNLPELLVQFGKKLKINGQLIISGPTENFVYKIGRFLAGFAGKGDYHHRNIDDIIKMAINNDFKIQKVRFLPFRFPPYLFKVISFVKNK
jgi:2-polyprenyl-3-methyl-5-hydroxy-6-metoxy-1,4-benzoquinol methylase